MKELKTIKFLGQKMLLCEVTLYGREHRYTCINVMLS